MTPQTTPETDGNKSDLDAIIEQLKKLVGSDQPLPDKLQTQSVKLLQLCLAERGRIQRALKAATPKITPKKGK